MDIVKSLLLSFITIGIEYRFTCKILSTRIYKPLAFFIMLAVHIFTGQLNIHLQLAGTIGMNTLYYGSISFLLNLLLFRGHLVKRLFIVVLLSCGIPISFYIFLPFAGYFFGKSPGDFSLALQILEYVNIILAAVIMEYIGRRFQNLRRELPAGYTVYLTAVLLFVQVAVCSGYDEMLARNSGIVTLPSAFISSVFAAAGIAIVIVAIFAVDRQVDVSLKEQLNIMQAENFKSREIEWRKLSRFRHDIKNHLLCLSGLLENGKTRQAVSYMENLTDTLKQIDSPVQTGNDYADALLSVKYAQALEADIQISLDMAIPPKGYVQATDLCCILSNAFDNAIAACKQLPNGERWISARSFIKQGQFVIEVKNSKPSFVTVTGGEVSPKAISADHGIGLDAVKAVVEQYGGILNLSADQEFSFSVLLPQNRL